MAAAAESNEIRITRVYDAPLNAVWDAWTVPEQVAKWWGPRGFTLTTHRRELRAGGHWRYTMHGPDGVDYPNLAKYHRVEPLRQLVYDHGATDDGPALFHVTASFSEAQGRTTLQLVFTLPSPEAAAQTALLIRQAGGNATWDRLAEHLQERATGQRSFVINRSLDAPITRVFEMWTQPEHLAKWLPPAGSTMRFLRAHIAVGQSSLFLIEGAHGRMLVRAQYLEIKLEIDAPRRLVYLQQFVDEHEQPAAAPGTAAWPATLRTTVCFAEEGPARTRVTVTCEPHGQAGPEQVDAFVAERAGMTLGWTGSFDALEALLP